MGLCRNHVNEIQIKHKLLYSGSNTVVIPSVLVKKDMLSYLPNCVRIWKISLGHALQFNCICQIYGNVMVLTSYRLKKCKNIQTLSLIVHSC